MGTLLFPIFIACSHCLIRLARKQAIEVKALGAALTIQLSAFLLVYFSTKLSTPNIELVAVSIVFVGP